MPGKVLIFGANSFLAKAFNAKFRGRFEIENVYRNSVPGSLGFDFESGDIHEICAKLKGPYKAILFFQGLNPSLGATDMTEAHFTRMLKVTLTTPALLLKELAPQLPDNALVLFMSSVATKKGSYDPSYGTAKAGIIGLMHSLANYWRNVRFNAISPGLVEGSPVYENMTADFREKHAARMFNNAFIKADDVINVVAELIENKGINRANIEVDGGYC